MNDWPAIATAISSATGKIFQFAGQRATSGGYINQAYRIAGHDGRQFFLKLNTAQRYPVLLSEVTGLNAIAATRTVRVPHVIVHGATDTHSYLVLEYLALSTQGNARLLGEQLALMHRCTSNQFGFAQDNHIGATRQPNGHGDYVNPENETRHVRHPRYALPHLNPLVKQLANRLSPQACKSLVIPEREEANERLREFHVKARTQDWIAFWREQRLGFQLQLAKRNGLGGKLQTLGDKLTDVLPAFFTSYNPTPSLLHGDLWSGNHGYLPDGAPVIFDPAVYYGDRECDLAMTELFGEFAPGFYHSYNAHFPLDAGYSARRDLYNLYHILNHANMFGGGYLPQAAQMMTKLLARIG
jgi:fructosamine-3-kinase